MSVKQEPCDSFEDDIKAESFPIYSQLEENDSTSRLQIFKKEDKDVFSEIKQEIIECELLKIEELHSLDLPTKIDHDSLGEKAQVPTLLKQEHVKTSEVKPAYISDIIKQEVSEYTQFKIESELLTSFCDLPTLKDEITDYPGSTEKRVSKQCCVIKKDYASLKTRVEQKNCLICKICGTTFASEFEFLQHYFIHSVKDKKKIVSRGSKENITNKTRYTKTFKLKRSVQQLKRCRMEKPLRCGICFSRFTNRKRLNIHLKSSHNFCFKQFRLPSKPSNHLLIHSNEKPFKCNIFSKEFRQKSNFQTHLKIHSNEKSFKCNICSKEFGQKSNLQTHLKIHTNEKPFKCNICLKGFGRKYVLQCHLKIHSNETPFKCRTCSRKFRDKSDLQDHLKIHNELSFKCYICSKEFGQKSNLRTHLKIHTNEKPFKCTICSKAFKRKCSLQSHLKIHTNEKPFKCSICSKEFKHKCNLQSHFIIHSKEKPFKCINCSKEFKHKCSLQYHLLIHSNEKLYKCTICSKQFRDNCSLQNHLLIHSNKESFKCDMCSKEFRHRFNFKRHLLTHSNRAPFNIS